MRGIAGWRGGRGGVEARGVAMRHGPLRDGWRGNASQSAHVRENAAQARVSGVSAALLGVASVDLCYNIRVPAERK